MEILILSSKFLYINLFCEDFDSNIKNIEIFLWQNMSTKSGIILSGQKILRFKMEILFLNPIFSYT